MRKWTPSIVPRDDHDVCLVVDDLGHLGRVWREAEFEATDFETVGMNLLDGQYHDPVAVVCFNAAEGWSRDVSENVVQELRKRRDAPSSIINFNELHEGHGRQLKLSLA
jgi:hypothetical protein